MVLALSLFVVSSNVAQRIYKMYIILIFVITVSDFVWDKWGADMEGEEWRHQVNIIYEVVVQEPVFF